MFDQHLILAASTKLFGMFPHSDISQLFKDGSFRMTTLSKDHILHLEGEPCSKLEVILSGRVVAERISETGDLLPVADFAKNDVLGGGLLFSQNPYYPMTIRVDQQSIIIQIPKDVLFSLLCSNPVFLLTYLELTSDRTSVLTNRIKNYLSRPLRECIASYLDHQSLVQQTKCIELPMTKTALAQQMGVQRTSLSRELKKMQDEGLLRVDRQSITILY